MKVSTTAIDGVMLIEQFMHTDYRGSFVKTFHATALEQAGITFNVQESFYSTSHINVIRGMHYHTAPKAHAKIVFCTQGCILDVALDIRKESATFGKYISYELNANNGCALYIPKGFAHGFATITENATAYYLVDGMYSAANDAGILYNSFGMKWPIDNPILNERDLGFIPLHQL